MLSLSKLYVGWKFGAPGVTTQELQSLLEKDESGGKVILLDNRAEGEFSVSKLDGAANLPLRLASEEPEELKKQVFGDQAGDADSVKAVVCYCSVGYRSAIVTNRLKAALGPDSSVSVLNLEGGLFQWANEGRPLAGGATGVHPFNSFWGRGLESRLWKWQ